MEFDRPLRMLAGILAVAAATVFSVLVGCAPGVYRYRADRDAYCLLQDKTQQPQWQTPKFSIDASPESRNFDPFPPVCTPLPPDDPAAHRYMHKVAGYNGSRRWHRSGDAAEIESPLWRESLPLTNNGELPLDRDRAVELALIHSREYQFELERLYLAALDVSLERFAFNLQWFAGNTTQYDFLGSLVSGRVPEDQSSLLTTTNQLGFSRAFTTGGQLLVDVANTFVWEFSGTNSSQSLSTVSVSLVQPLLRGAFRDIRMEPLTQSERSLLYTARDYARFRKQFYFNFVSGDEGFLALLVQLQAIRNLESNLASLQRNLREHEALAQAGIISVLRVDQVFQSYQAGRLRLIRARNDFQTALDTYKINMGLPPELEIALDDSLLKPFELNSPEIAELQVQLEDLLATYRRLDDAPDLEQMAEGWERLQTLHAQAQEQHKLVLADWQQWSDQASAESQEDSQEQREAETKQALKLRLDELQGDLAAVSRQIAAAANELDESTRTANWTAIQTLSRKASAQADDLFVIQSQIRAYLIVLQPLRLTQDDALDYALENRLDLMNRQAEVVDAWRHVHVAENALRADLDLFTEAVVGTSPGANPVRFSSDASRFRFGVRFDSPLNRFVERNNYRAEQIDYQRARRAYIASRDTIVQAVRLDFRSLEADRLNFEIARQSLIAAARQVELAKVQLSAPKLEGDSSSTQDALNALNTLLDAKNALIAVWVSYETNRLRLSLDTEAMQLDESGLQQEDEGSTGKKTQHEAPPDNHLKADAPQNKQSKVDVPIVDAPERDDELDNGQTIRATSDGPISDNPQSDTAGSDAGKLVPPEPIPLGILQPDGDNNGE